MYPERGKFHLRAKFLTFNLFFFILFLRIPLSDSYNNVVIGTFPSPSVLLYCFGSFGAVDISSGTVLWYGSMKKDDGGERRERDMWR